VSLRDQILNSNDIPKELIKVKEWNIEVEVRGMTGAERTRILDLAQSDGGSEWFRMIRGEHALAGMLTFATYPEAKVKDLQIL